MKSRTILLLGAGAGAAAMYYLDPARGRYRRALVRDRFVHTGHQARHGLGVVSRDMRNRTLGTTATVRSLFTVEQPPDAVLADRVRACLGRVVTHPASIDVSVRDGVVTLSGPILADEVPELIECARHVRGVRDVEDRLEVHEEAGHVPGLQGRPRQRPGQRSAFMQANWSPTARAIGGAAGTWAVYYGLGRRVPGAGLLTGAGLLLLGRALTNLELGRLLGFGETPYTVSVQKSVRIHAPVETVYGVWQDFERFPTFMTHVARVRRVHGRGDRECWRWTVRAPGGLQTEFNAVVTAREENRLLAWRTENGALVHHTGRIQFTGHDDGSTTVDVKLVYQPVGGALGHTISKLLGADPKHQLDDDLLRTKTFLETGKPPHDAAVPITAAEAPHGAGAPAEAAAQEAGSPERGL